MGAGKMMQDVNQFLITRECSIKQAMKKMTEIGQKVLFVVNENNSLIGSLSDGDIRKWILSGGNLRESALRICNKKPKFITEDCKIDDVKKIMLKFLIGCVPALDGKLKIAKIFTWNDVFSEDHHLHRKKLNVDVFVMAGGLGVRLDPFTKILPKPLIPVGDKPIIEIIMDKFNEYGINKFYVSINHKSKMIKSYFDDTNGQYQIFYIEEEKPLGTAGSLRLVKNKCKDILLVTNCDIIVESDYAEVIKFHKHHNYDMTLVVSCRHYVIPYGVCKIESGGELKNINEKPEYDLLVNTGMYVINKKIINLIPRNTFFNLNELVIKAKKNKLKIGVFPISEDSWIDIGQWEEYHKALEKIKVKI